MNIEGLQEMNQLIDCLSYIFLNFPKLKSDYAREKAFIIAEACSRGYITTINVEGKAQDFWMVTLKGYNLLKGVKKNESVV